MCDGGYEHNNDVTTRVVVLIVTHTSLWYRLQDPSVMYFVKLQYSEH